MQPIPLHRTGLILKPDPSRVLLRPFQPGNEPRQVKIISRVLALTEPEVDGLLAQVLGDFADRHLKLREHLRERFEAIRPSLPTDQKLSGARQLLIGSYFTQEYSLESAALFNPSIVSHPDQTRLPAGARRFILSLRATGEGHISSITFRTGVIDAGNNVTIHAPTRYVTNPRPIPSASYEKALFERKLAELGLNADFCHRVLDSLPGQFTLAALRASLADAQKQARGRDAGTVGAIRALAQSNYEVQFTKEQQLSERVIFPHSPSQSNGIEDARFVRLRDDDGARTYYATYTAYDGRVTFPQLLETKDFLRFKFSTLNGPAVQNKGMALFPRKIRGLYAMLSRQDNENIHLMYSENLHFWYESRTILKPARPWEFVQLGNCGSPIETDAGWLVLSHGVGPMRHYCIGAFLLDRADPAKVIGRLREPLITPNHAEREGYVPNVVYSCGALLHGRTLVIPYAMSDSASSFATASLDDILAAME